MNDTLTAIQLAEIAAQLDPTAQLPPEEAVARAIKLYQAAKRMVCAEEASPQDDLAEFRPGAERNDSLGLGHGHDKITLKEAFEYQKQIAERYKAKPYKVDTRFSLELRRAKLIVTERILGMTLQEWVSSPEPEIPIVETLELTSARAVEHLFQMKHKRRKALENQRKAKKKPAKSAVATNEIFENRSRNLQATKAKLPLQKRNEISKKRNAIVQKRKGKITLGQ